MTREEYARNRSWILKVIRDRCELTRAETDYLNDLIEVIDQIPNLKEAYDKGYKDGQKALAVHLELCKEEEEPTAKEHLVVEDCISRKAVLEPYQTLNDNDTICIWLLRKNIEQQPSVIPQPKTGHWEWVQYDYNSKLGDWHCSECKSVVIECVSKEEKGGIPLYKYCPQCGAKMVESQESEG